MYNSIMYNSITFVTYFVAHNKRGMLILFRPRSAKPFFTFINAMRKVSGQYADIFACCSLAKFGPWYVIRGHLVSL